MIEVQLMHLHMWPALRNWPLSILFHKAVAAHKGSLVDNTVRGHKEIANGIKIATFFANILAQFEEL